jgi:hypothetical protein
MVRVYIYSIPTLEEYNWISDKNGYVIPLESPSAGLSCQIYTLALLSCLVLSCLVLSGLVLSCLVVSCRVLSYLVLSYLVLSCLVLSCRAVSCLVLSCLVLSCSVRCPVLSRLVLGCPVLSCLVIRLQTFASSRSFFGGELNVHNSTHVSIFLKSEDKTG